MEKVYSLLWILFAVGVYVFHLFKKAQETTERESRERPRQTGAPTPTLPQPTFQEMLKQMQERNAGQPAAEHTPAGRPLPQELARPAQSQERTAVRPKSLERTEVAPHSLEVKAPVPVYAAALPRASTEAPITDYWQERELRRVREQSQEALPLNQSVRRLLTQPENVRAAFVLSEILQRRQF
ncbi:hypothetical protein GCM10023185_29240 [Hymenobacter saemangeumensis]|uniref:Uncharacterized protein n=1 Tax=Hymenobacter saemangeumensis TaxID=1084522 RepID=A0ABP8ILK5_9BACT